MPMYDAEDIVELKNKTKRKQRLIRLTVFLFLAGAGAALYLCGKVDNIKEGVALAGRLIDSGKALETLRKFIDVSNRSEANAS